MNEQDILNRLKSIEERNRRVESDKAWETSYTRMFLLGAITYLVALVFLISTKLPQPFLNAVVPAIGFMLSVQTVPIAKKWWLKKMETKIEPGRPSGPPLHPS